MTTQNVFWVLISMGALIYAVDVVVHKPKEHASAARIENRRHMCQAMFPQSVLGPWYEDVRGGVAGGSK